MKLSFIQWFTAIKIAKVHKVNPQQIADCLFIVKGERVYAAYCGTY